MSRILVITFVILFYTKYTYSQTINSNVVSNAINYNPDIEYGFYIDSRDGKSYKTLKIGSQIWMAENLAYLPSINSIYEESFTKTFYYVYAFDGSKINDALQSENYKTYGVLYNYTAALIACPDGWHLPLYDEWNELIVELKSDFLAGNKMKESGTNHWINNHTSATNESGLTVLPGGSVVHDNEWNDLGKKANIWVAKSRDSNHAIAISLANYSSWAAWSFFPKNSGLSVRCLKD